MSTPTLSTTCGNNGCEVHRSEDQTHRQNDGLDEARAICVDLGYHLNDVVYDSVTVRNNVVTLDVYVRDYDCNTIVDHGPDGPELRTRRERRRL